MVQKEILMSNGKGHALEEPDYTPNVEIMFWILKYKCSIFLTQLLNHSVQTGFILPAIPFITSLLLQQVPG